MKIIFFAAMTVNGKIAHARDELVDWTSKEDKQFFHAETKKCGVMVMGNATYKTISRPLPGRLNVVLTHTPEKEKNQEGALEFTDAPLAELIGDLEMRGFESIAVTGGAAVFSQFLEEGLADELIITVEPKIFGKGINIFSDMKKDFSLELLSIRKLSAQVFALHYKVLKK